MSTTYENVVKASNNDLILLPRRSKFISGNFIINIEQEYNNNGETFKPNGFGMGVGIVGKNGLQMKCQTYTTSI